MDVVLVGLPGSGKSVVGRRLAQPPRRDVRRPRRAHRDARPAGRSRRSSPTDGEAGVPAPRAGGRRRPRAGRPGPGDPARRSRPAAARSSTRATAGRSTAAGRPIWLDGRPEVLAQRLRRSPARPAARSTAATRSATIRDLGARRGAVLRRGRHPRQRRRRGPRRRRRDRGRGSRGGSRRRRARPSCAPTTPIGADRRSATGSRAERAATRCAELERPARDPRLRARRVGGRRRAIARRRSRERGWPVEHDPAAAGRGGQAPGGRSRRRRSELGRLRVERGEPLVAIGGGALGDAAGFLAATYLRGVPVIHVPTTLVAQIDSSIGGKTGVDLPEGKNLVGAFHQPAAIVIDVAAARDAPRAPAPGGPRRGGQDGGARRRAAVRAARGATARRSPRATRRPFDRGAVAEVVERAAWAKVEVVAADERERDAAGGRITLNLGHSLGHAVEAAGRLRRAAPRRGGRATASARRAGSASRSGVTPPERAARIDAPARRASSLATSRSPTRSTRSSATWPPTRSTPAARCAGSSRPRDGVVVRDDVDPATSSRRAAAALAGAAGASARDDARPRPPGPEPQPARHARAGDLRPRDARRDPRRDRGAGGRARPRRRLLPVEPRGRADRPAAPSATSTSRSSTPAG